MVYVMYRLPSVEKMTNIDKATEDKIREIYKIDTDAIRNLSNLAKDLTVNGKLTVPGGLEIKGKMDVEKNTYIKGLLKVNRTDEHPWNPGWGNGVHTWDMKVDASADINNLSVRNNVTIANDLVFNGKNNWIFHTPNDGRHVVYISPSKAQGNTEWDWGKGMELHPDGKVVIKGDLEVHGNINCTKGLVVNDLHKPWGDRGLHVKHNNGHFTHINWVDNGEIYLRGTTNLDGNLNNAPNVLKNDERVTIRSLRTGRRLQDNSTNARFEHGGRGQWETFFLEKL